jgi:hypothetical protein
LKNKFVIMVICLIFITGIGFKINGFGSSCNSPDDMRKSYSMSASGAVHVVAGKTGRNFEPLFHCNFSKTVFQIDVFQIKITSRHVYTYGFENPEKADDLHDVFVSYSRILNNSFMAIPILLQKESFLT